MPPLGGAPHYFPTRNKAQVKITRPAFLPRGFSGDVRVHRPLDRRPLALPSHSFRDVHIATSNRYALPFRIVTRGKSRFQNIPRVLSAMNFLRTSIIELIPRELIAGSRVNDRSVAPDAVSIFQIRCF